MKTGKLFYAFIVCLFILGIMSLAYKHYVVPQKYYYLNETPYWQYVKANNSSFEYGYFGSSHTAYALDPSYLDNSYVFASSGLSTANYYELAQSVLKDDNVTIKTYVIEIDLISLSSGMEGFPYIVRQGKEKPLIYYEPNLYRDFEEIILNGHELFTGWPLRRSEPRREYNLGYNPSHSSFLYEYNDTERITRAAVEYNRSIRGQNLLSPKSVSGFKRILKLAHDSNASLILLRYPHSSQFEVLIKDLDQKEHYKEIMRLVEENYGKNYTIHDYHDFYFTKDNYNASYFADAAHLNSEGAYNFSRTINRAVRITRTQ